MKEWKAPEMVDLRIALTAGGHQGKGNGNGKGNNGGHSGHILTTPIPTVAPIEDESNIVL